MSYQDCCGYFEGKLNQWNPAEPYITTRNVDGIYEEIQIEELFKRAVCNYVKQFAQHRRRTIVLEIIAAVGAPPPFNLSKIAIDIFASAVLKACGHERESKDLFKYALLGAAIIAALGIGYSIWKAEQPKKRRKSKTQDD
jgi:hypothetical protein